MWMQLAGLGLSMLSSYQKNKHDAELVENNNAALIQQHNQNIQITQEMLSTLDERTNIAESEAVRASIRKKMDVSKARHKAEGEATVRAAQMGGGAGVRASLNLVKPAARVAGDMITDANINLQTELDNITQHYNDTANKAIQNLSNQTPALGTAPSTGEMLLASAGAGLTYYNGMSAASKADIKSIFTSTDNNIKTGGTTAFDYGHVNSSGVAVGF